MNNQDKPPADTTPKADTGSLPQINLRQQAEASLQAKRESSAEQLEDLSPEALQAILHELHVHQIELELQNEELCQAQIELNVTKAYYFDLYDLAPV
jgi:phage-related minor tail protein